MQRPSTSSGCMRTATPAPTQSLFNRRDVRAEPGNAGIGWLSGWGWAAVRGTRAALVGLRAHGDVGAAGADWLAAELIVHRLLDVAEAAAAIGPRCAGVSVHLAGIERGERAVIPGQEVLAGHVERGMAWIRVILSVR